MRSPSPLTSPHNPSRSQRMPSSFGGQHRSQLCCDSTRSDRVDSLHIRPRAKRSIAVLTAAVLATVVSPVNAETLKLRCESALVESASSTSYIEEVNSRITQIWDSSGYEETSPASFEDGVWRWMGWRSRESGRVIAISLDRRTGEVFGAIQDGSERLLPLGPICRWHNFPSDNNNPALRRGEGFVE